MAEAQAARARLEALRIDRSTHPRRRRLRRWLVPAVLLFLVLAAVVMGLAGRAPTVRVAEVREARPGEQQTELSAAGYVASKRRSIIAPLIPGRLVEVTVEEGDAVQKGQVLARLDDRDARVAILRAESEVLSAEARLAGAQVQALNARRTAARTRRLASAGAVAPAQLQDVETANRAAIAEGRAAEAQLGAARRAVEAARLQLTHTIVRAPFAGTVARKLADEGAVLAPAALEQANLGGIVELVDLQALEVQAEVSEEQLSRIEPGQPALIFLDAFPDRVFRARTGTVRPAIDRSKATAQVKVEFLSPPASVLPDMGAKVSFLSQEVPTEELEGKEEDLRVPVSAVVPVAGSPSVWVVKDGRLEHQPVKVGERREEEVVLEEGPPAGTQVVLAPDPRLRDGRRVKVRTEGG
ncbi:efflux RND transporter periplasmic adaptor subunit [Hyalangium gracile]|uniref:efflux RND transporter periplasmic adaptor subunit n=1 Tax=Hyalangium gracile TaxID=394092 RepID=UPI001CCDB0CD|nr:efflux RND transporter periplasmic adaptor subunit [Hyalangium gracile]